MAPSATSPPPDVPATCGALAVSPFLAWQMEMQRALLQTAKTFAVLSSPTAAAVGQTPKEVIWRQGTAQRLRYRRTTPVRYPLPRLVVHSLVAKP